MKIKNWEAILWDCLEVMKKMESNSIDLIVTSPPYDNLRTYNWTLNWSFEIFKEIAKECARVIKKWWVIVWVVWDATIKWSETWTSFRQALYFKDECWLNLHDTMIYAKNNYVPLTHNRYEQQFEYMFVFSKWKPKIFNAIKIETKSKGKKMWTKHTFRQEWEETKPFHTIREFYNDFKISPNIFFYNTNASVKWHPAIFPEKLAEDHILSWSNEWDIVLDPFAGSFTTWKMAENTNRRWIAIEKDESYFNIWIERIWKTHT